MTTNIDTSSKLAQRIREYERKHGGLPSYAVEEQMAYDIETEALQEQADKLAREECPVETNEGTYSAAECLRAVGTGDPAFGDYTIYEQVGSGTRRVVGCDPDRAPGYARPFRDAINAKRAELKKLKQQIADRQKARR